MKRLHRYSVVTLILSMILVIGLLLGICWLIFPLLGVVLLHEVVNFRVRYVITCYKLVNSGDLSNYKLNKFDKFIEDIFLENLRKEIKLDEKISKKASVS